MDLYAENILEHAKHPHRKLLLTMPTVDHGEVNASCGDAVRMQLKIEDGRITDVGWEGEGCAISQAGMSLFADALIGNTVIDAGMMNAQTVRALLGVDVGPRRVKCALLCLHALKNALRKMEGEEPQGWRETLEEASEK